MVQRQVRTGIAVALVIGLTACGSATDAPEPPDVTTDADTGGDTEATPPSDTPDGDVAPDPEGHDASVVDADDPVSEDTHAVPDALTPDSDGTGAPDVPALDTASPVDSDDAPAPEVIAAPDAIVPTDGGDEDGAGPADDAGEAPGGLECGDLPVCDDFESYAVGSPPDVAVWEVVSPNCSGDGTIVVDDAWAFSGSRSIRVQSSGGYCNHVFATPTASIGAVDAPLYGRFYVRFGVALDMAHVTFVAMKDQVDEKDLRMGGQNEILMWNRELGDATLPELSPTGVSMSVKPLVDQWICIAFAIDGVAGTLHTWVDGELVAGLVIDGVGTPDIDNQWLNMDWHPELVDARFGWESYGGVPMTLWYDDIALSPDPLPCPD